MIKNHPLTFNEKSPSEDTTRTHTALRKNSSYGNAYNYLSFAYKSSEELVSSVSFKRLLELKHSIDSRTYSMVGSPDYMSPVTEFLF